MDVDCDSLLLGDGGNVGEQGCYVVQVVTGRLRDWYLGYRGSAWALVARRCDAARFVTTRAAIDGWRAAREHDIIARLLKEATFEVQSDL